MESYRNLLRDIYQSRKTKNHRYSLRAFAKNLGQDPSHLVAILNNRRDLTIESGIRIVKKAKELNEDDFLETLIIERICKYIETILANENLSAETKIRIKRRFSSACRFEQEFERATNS